MRVRPAVSDLDRDVVYAISVHESVRLASTRSDYFSWFEHCDWWIRKMADASTRIYMAENDKGELVGYIRYGRVAATSDAEIAIAVAWPERRNGYAIAMLEQTQELAKRELGVNRLVALVLTTNSASSGLFERAGFHMTGWVERMKKQHQRWVKDV